MRHVFPLDLVDLKMSELLNELVEMHETSSDSDKDLITLLNLDEDPLLAKPVNSFRLTQKQNLELGPFGEGVECLTQGGINLVRWLCMVNGPLRILGNGKQSFVLDHNCSHVFLKSLQLIKQSNLFVLLGEQIFLEPGCVISSRI